MTDYNLTLPLNLSMLLKIIHLLSILAYFSMPSFCQSDFSLTDLRDDYLSSLQTKVSAYESNVLKNRDKVIKKYLSTEKDFINNMYSNDSSALREKLKLLDQSYRELDEHLTNVKVTSLGTYVPYLDTVKQTLLFIQESCKKITSGSYLSIPQESRINELIQEITNIKVLEKQREVLDRFINQRLDNYRINFPTKRFGHLARMRREFEVYQQRLNGFKSVLQDPRKIEKKVISELVKSQSYRQFFKRNSELASFFRLPGSDESITEGSPSPNLAGLQTKETVRASLSEHMGGTQVDLQAYLNESIGNANGIFEKLQTFGVEREKKDSGKSNLRQNSLRGKPLKARMEYGFNLQSQRSTNLLPASSEIGLSAGYKIDDSRTIGIGASYRWGWGPNLREISITSEGIGLRSFLDWHIWRRIWVTGAFECNYQASFDRIQQLNSFSAWQQSGLVGVTHKYRVGKMKGQIQLFWDFLSYQQAPQTQALKFRIGWSF